MRLSSLFPPVGLLAALAGALTVSLTIKIAGSRILSTDTDVFAEPGNAAPGGTAFDLPQPSDATAALNQFAQRPLFAEGRRTAKPPPPEPEPLPPPDPVVEQPASEPPVVQPPDPPQIAMVGMMRNDETRSALIRDLVTGEERWIAEGELIGAWTLAQITQESIRLEVEDNEITFNLFQERLP